MHNPRDNAHPAILVIYLLVLFFFCSIVIFFTRDTHESYSTKPDDYITQQAKELQRQEIDARRQETLDRAILLKKIELDHK